MSPKPKTTSRLISKKLATIGPPSPLPPVSEPVSGSSLNSAVNSSSEPILTAEQVAERLQLKPSTIYELTRRRNQRPLPALKAGKFLRFRWSEIEQWLSESRRAA
jgi:excisionase family DNA binding protein